MRLYNLLNTNVIQQTKCEMVENWSCCL